MGASFEANFIDCGAYHCCAISQKIDSKCWGWNARGQLGQGDTNNRGDQDGEMGDNLKIIDLGSDFIIEHISCGGAHTCVLSTNNSIKCFGWNEYGQLGYEHTENMGDDPNEMGDDLPSVDLGSKFEPIQVECAARCSCAVSINFQVKCWGCNLYGELGQGDNVTRGATKNTMGEFLTGIDLGNHFNVTDIHCGTGHVCALSTSKDIKCWGFNVAGQLGLGDIENRGDDINEMGDNLPTVDMGADFVPHILATGFAHTLSVSIDGTLRTWGYGDYGQLGYGSTGSGGYLPSVDLGMGSGSHVITNSDSNQAHHTCAWLRNDSYFLALKCFGRNDYGQLGVGDYSNRGDEKDEMGDFLPVVLGFQRMLTIFISSVSLLFSLIVNDPNRPAKLHFTDLTLLGDTLCAKPLILDQFLNFLLFAPNKCSVNFTTPPTVEPSADPTAAPTSDPTNDPTNTPTVEPSENPTNEPTVPVEPSINPTLEPTINVTMDSSDGDNKESSPRYAMSFGIIIGCIIGGVVCVLILPYAMMRTKWYRHGRHSNEADIELPPMRMEMNKGLIANISIGQYDGNGTNSENDSLQLDVDAVVNDMRQFADDFGYEYMPIDDKTYWTEQEILSFLRDDVGNAYFDETDQAKYDGLIVCVTSRGDERNVLSSDHQPMDKVAIHRTISNKYATIRDFPRIFIFDSCASVSKHASTTSMRTQNALLTTSIGLTTQHVVAASSGELSEWMENDDIKENDTELANDVGKATTLEDVRGKYEWTSSNNNPDYNLVTMDAVGQMFVPNAVHCFLERVRQNAENQEELGMTDVMDKVKADLDLQRGSTFVHVLNNKTRTMVIRKNNTK